MRTTQLIALFILLTNVGCSQRLARARKADYITTNPKLGQEEFNNLMLQKVASAAEFDLACPVEKMRFSVLDHGVYGAVGCGQRARYIGRDEICFDQNARVRLVRDCVVVMDSYRRVAPDEGSSAR